MLGENRSSKQFMARTYRIQFDGARYHVVATGMPRRKLFRNEEDMYRMVGMIRESAEKRGVLVHAYCLLDDRVELVVETPKGNISKFQQGYKTGYSSYFRKKHGVTGKLFADRFKAKLLEVDHSILLHAVRHVHLLPVRSVKHKGMTPAKLVAAAAAWKWSSFGPLLKPVKGETFPTGVALKAVGGRVTERPKHLRAFTLEDFAERDLYFKEIDGASRIAIGSEEFIAHYESGHAKFQRGQKPGSWNEYGKPDKKRLSKRKIETAVCKALKLPRAEVVKRRKGSLNRPLLSWALYEYGGLTQDEIAAHLELSAGATVSQHSRRVREAEKSDKKFARIVTKVRSELR